MSGCCSVPGSWWLFLQPTRPRSRRGTGILNLEKRKDKQATTNGELDAFRWRHFMLHASVSDNLSWLSSGASWRVSGFPSF